MDDKILLIDDDLVEAERFQASLQRAGFLALLAPPTRKALRLAKAQKPALVILCLNGRGTSPPNFHQSVRRAVDTTPLLFVPPPGLNGMQAEQFTTVQRPVTTRRLLYHVRRVLKEKKPSCLKAGKFVLDYENQCVWKEDAQHPLRPKEFKLLELFMSKVGQVLSRKEIMQAVWETSYMGDTRTLYVHVRWLRRKLEEDPCQPQHIRTVRGIGYVFNVSPAPASA